MEKLSKKSGKKNGTELFEAKCLFNASVFASILSKVHEIVQFWTFGKKRFTDFSNSIRVLPLVLNVRIRVLPLVLKIQILKAKVVPNRTFKTKDSVIFKRNMN